MSTRPLEASRPRQFRRTKIIDSSLQFKLVGAFLAVACVAALFQVLLMNHSIMNVVREAPAAGDQLLVRIPGLLARNLVLTLGVLVPITLVVGILVTHRIAGPAFVMERYLRRIAEGERPESPCRLRKGDSLGDLCRALNVAVGSVTGEDAGKSGREEDVSTELDEVSSLVPRSETAQEESVQAAGEPQAEAETETETEID